MHIMFLYYKINKVSIAIFCSPVKYCNGPISFVICTSKYVANSHNIISWLEFSELSVHAHILLK